MCEFRKYDRNAGCDSRTSLGKTASELSSRSLYRGLRELTSAPRIKLTLAVQFLFTFLSNQSRGRPLRAWTRNELRRINRRACICVFHTLKPFRGSDIRTTDSKMARKALLGRSGQSCRRL